MKRALLILVIAAVAGVVCWGRFNAVRNDLMAQRESMSAQWSAVDAALGRRAELLPSLVEAIRRSGRDEAKALAEIAAARSAFAAARTPQERIAANDRISAALAGLLDRASEDPKLRESETLDRLQEDIADAESRIALERRKYNEALEHYNAQIQRFPDNLVASLSGFTRNDAYFPTEPGAR